jgi:hypothetical protein
LKDALSGGLSLESFKSAGSPIHVWKGHYLFHLPQLNLSEGERMRRILGRGTGGCIVEGTFLTGLGAGVQLLMFGFKGGPNPPFVVAAATECALATHTPVDRLTHCDAFGIVASGSLGYGGGVTGYYGVWI